MDAAERLLAEYGPKGAGGGIGPALDSAPPQTTDEPTAMLEARVAIRIVPKPRGTCVPGSSNGASNMDEIVKTRHGEVGGSVADGDTSPPAGETEEVAMTAFDRAALKARVDEILNHRPAVGLAIGVVRDGSLESFHAHGLADIASGTPVTENTVFRIASISKTFTAVAVMQLWEQGLVELDAPANDYLRTFRLVPAKEGWRPAMVRHLLTHTAGVPEWVHPSRMINSGWFGESFALGEALPTLAEYYRGGLRLAAEPGTVWTYTDHGFATLGQIVEDVSGMSLHRYLRERIFEPLGMESSDLLRSERVRARLATGYRLGSKGARAVTDRQWVTAAASSIYSTPRDMARYVAALLGDGPILEPETLALMFGPHYRPDPRIPGMGLAFWRGALGGHLAVEHQGVLPGFNSQIFLSPDDGVGVMAFTNGSRNAATWLTGETQRLLGDLIGAPADGIRTDVPQHPEVWGGLCGWYKPVAQRTDMQARFMLCAGVEVLVRRGRLTVRTLSPIPALYRGFPLHPDDPEDPYVFRIDLSPYGMGTARIVFSRDADGATTGLHLDGILLSAEKRPASRNPRRWATGAIGVVADRDAYPDLDVLAAGVRDELDALAASTRDISGPGYPARTAHPERG